MAWFERNDGLIFPWWRTTTIDDDDVDGVWQAVGAGSLVKSYDDLVNAKNISVLTGTPGFSNLTGWSFDSSQTLTTSITGTGSQSFLVKISNQPAADKNTVIGYASGARNHFIEINPILPAAINITYGYNVTSSTPGNIAVTDSQNLIVGMARNRFFVDGSFISTVGALATWSSGTFNIGKSILNGNYIGNMEAAVIYNRLLTDAEMGAISTNMLALSPSMVTGGQNVNYIAQHPGTRHLNSTSHELLAATDGGLFRTYNGGRRWKQVKLSTPSNAEFADSPAAAVEELTFHWCAYDPVTNQTLYTLGYKSSAQRVWLYASSDDGDTWSSRGVIAT